MEEFKCVELDELLTKWGLKSLIKKFRDDRMDLMAMKYLDNDSIKRLIPHLGDNLKFRAMLKEWMCTEKSLSVTTVGDNNYNPVHRKNLNQELFVTDGLPLSIMEGDNLQLLSTPSSSSSDAVQKTSYANPPSVDVSARNVEETAVDNNFSNVLSVDEVGSDQSSESVLKRGGTPGISNVVPSTRSKEYDLKSVLDKTDDGRKLKSAILKVKTPTCKNEHERQVLASAIIKHELAEDCGKSISKDRFEVMRNAVIELFPQENPIVWYERLKDGKGKWIQRGKLVWRYYNLRRDFKEWGLLEKTKIVETSEVTTDEPGENPNRIEGSLLWLETNAVPHDTARHHWKLTSKYRVRHRENSSDKESILDYLKKYPALLEGNGIELLLLDFEVNWPHASMALFEQWATLSAFFQDEITKRIPDFLTDSNYSASEKILITLLNVGQLMPVSTIASRKKRGKQRSTDGNKEKNASLRPSKAQIQDAFLLKSATEIEMLEHLQQRASTLYDFGLCLQPVSVLIGTSEQPDRFLVVIDEFSWEVTSSLKAIDAVLKSCLVLRVHYPPEAEGLWYFLQHYVYDIKTKLDKNVASAKDMGGKFLEFKKRISE